ncbi:hypothetical protein [Agromyces ramosus]|uniref:Membrane protein n=1 Tax=Agromyces ramosus TaxID=33879 RepID=A0ABU0R3X3_9MICO|nr:hypothetical protein [Agromyces ramosus]MDQ0892768.1 putative membrane protein [Agromyces ramosus]
MGYSRSPRADGIWLAVGVLAVLIAVAECVAAIVLVNRPGVAAAVGLPEWGVLCVNVTAIGVIVLLVISMLIGVIPRGAPHWDAPRSRPAG